MLETSADPTPEEVIEGIVRATIEWGLLMLLYLKAAREAANVIQ